MSSCVSVDEIQWPARPRMINEKREKVPTRIKSVTNHTVNYVLPTQDSDPRKSQPMATDHFMERLGESDKEERGRAGKERAPPAHDSYLAWVDQPSGTANGKNER